MSNEYSQAICEVCRSTLPDVLLKRRFKRDHQPSLRALIDSAARGCRACEIIHHNFAYTGYPNKKLDEGCISIGRLSAQNRLRVFLSTADSEVLYGDEIAFYFSSEEVRTSLSPKFDDEENIALVKALISDCIRNHPRCSSNSQDLPTRLLDVSPSGSDFIVRIISGFEAQDICKRYISLSHCWGLVPPDAPWKLTKARMASYARELPLEILPLTFRQAIQYTRNLGERFLWIDSLCIIQDSAEDWAKEASQMATIYANSICTISAATASSLEGCMLPRESSIIKPLEIDLDSGGKAFLVPSVPAEDKLQQTVPVTGRAWCLQERELTIRLVQFTSYQWLWSCKTANTSERILRELGVSDKNFATKGNAGLRFSGADASTTAISRADGTFSDGQDVKDWKQAHGDYESWYKVVETFTRCQITYPADRLPAIAGMAHRQQDQTPDTYLAGLWEKDLCFGLNWACSTPQDVRSREYIAPSWSWACLNSQVRFNGYLHYKNHHSPTLISAHTGPDSLGVLKGGYLHMRGKLKAASTGTEFVKVEMPFGNERYEGTFRSLHYANALLGTLRVDTKEDAKVCDEVICLPLLHVHGIALKSVDVEGAGLRPAYRRVGSIRIAIDKFLKDVEGVEFDLY